MEEQQIINDILDRLYGNESQSEINPEIKKRIKKEKEEKYDEMVKQINFICKSVEKELKSSLGNDINGLSKNIKAQVLKSIQAEVANGNNVLDSNGKIRSGKIVDLVMQSKEEFLEKTTVETVDEHKSQDTFEEAENYKNENKEREDIIKELENTGIDFSEEEIGEIYEDLTKAKDFIKRLDQKVEAGMREDEVLDFEIEEMSVEELKYLRKSLHTYGQIISIEILDQVKGFNGVNKDGDTSTVHENVDEDTSARENEESVEQDCGVDFSVVNRSYDNLERLKKIIDKVDTKISAKSAVTKEEGSRKSVKRKNIEPGKSRVHSPKYTGEVEDVKVTRGTTTSVVDDKRNEERTYEQLSNGTIDLSATQFAPVAKDKLSIAIRERMAAINYGNSKRYTDIIDNGIDAGMYQKKMIMYKDEEDIRRIVTLVSDFHSKDMLENRYTGMTDYHNGKDATEETTTVKKETPIEPEKTTQVTQPKQPEDVSQSSQSIEGEPVAEPPQAQQLPKPPQITDKELVEPIALQSVNMDVFPLGAQLPQVEDMVVSGTVREAIAQKHEVDRRRLYRDYNGFSDRKNGAINLVKKLYGVRGSYIETEASIGKLGAISRPQDERTEEQESIKGNKTPGTTDEVKDIDE